HLVARRAANGSVRSLQPANGRIMVARSGRHARQQSERVEIGGVALEDELGFLARIVVLADEGVNGSELESDLEVVWIELLSLHQEAVCLSNLAQLVVHESQLAHRTSIALVNAQGVSVLDHGFAVLLTLRVAIGPLEIARLLGLEGSVTGDKYHSYRRKH